MALGPKCGFLSQFIHKKHAFGKPFFGKKTREHLHICSPPRGFQEEKKNLKSLVPVAIETICSHHGDKRSKLQSCRVEPWGIVVNVSMCTVQFDWRTCPWKDAVNWGTIAKVKYEYFWIGDLLQKVWLLTCSWLMGSIWLDKTNRLKMSRGVM